MNKKFKKKKEKLHGHRELLPINQRDTFVKEEDVRRDI